MRVETVPVPLAGTSATYSAYLADGRSRRPAVVICPGGGWEMLAPAEAEPVALFFLSQGYQAFVLNYTVGARPEGALRQATLELAATVRDIRLHAKDYGIKSTQLAVAGFSAGGAVAATFATRWDDARLGLAASAGCSPKDLRPQAAVLAYPVTDFSGRLERARAEAQAAGSRGDADPLAPAGSPSAPTRYDFVLHATELTLGEGVTAEDLVRESPISHVSRSCPPTFVWGTADDDVVWSGQFLSFAQRLVEKGVPCELHLYEHGPHALSLANASTVRSSVLPELGETSTWSAHAVAFLRRHLEGRGA